MLPARYQFFIAFSLACLPTLAVDVLAHGDISFWGLYLVPVALAGWLRGRNFGLVIALVCFAFMLLAAAWVGHRFDHTWQFVVAMGNRVLSLLVVAWLASICRRVSELQSLLNSYRGESTFQGER